MMLLKLGRLAVPLVFLFVAGCQQPIKWSIQPKWDPDPVKIGKKFTASCKVTGELEKIEYVAAVPIVAPEFTMELRDEGKEGDEKAGDGIFTTSGSPPAEAEPGDYDIEFVVYDKNGDPIMVPSFTVYDKDGKVTKEVEPKAEEGKEPEPVEFSSIIIITLE